VQDDKTRHVTSTEKQRKLLEAFQGAVMSGQTSVLEQILATDAHFISDHGGKAKSVLKVLNGVAEISRFIARGLHRFWQDYEWVAAEVNGLQGFILKTGDTVNVSVAFEFDDDDRISEIFLMRNPDKLQRLGNVRIH
ncbi:MAG: hypothetical protein V7727_16280, partial [Sneathiella sp.]